MYRRISSVFEFKNPNHTQRKKIWEIHIANQICVAADVDLDKISLRYELSGIGVLSFYYVRIIYIYIYIYIYMYVCVCVLFNIICANLFMYHTVFMHIYYVHQYLRLERFILLYLRISWFY